MRTFDQVVEAVAKRTQHIFATAQGSQRHQRLTQRVEQLYGILELARLFEYGHLARRIETHIDVLKREIESE